MTDEKPRKSGRTAEQQAARDARKAAKKAAAEATTEDAPSDTAAVKSKRKRDEQDDADLLEIDLGAEKPLSKAEARAAKKRAKRGDDEPKAEDGEEADGDKPKSAPKKDKVERVEKGKFSIWIGNLSFRTTPESLKTFLENGVVELGGEADSVTRVHLPKKAGRGEFSENKGFAYCDFKTESQQLLAVSLSERPFEGRRVLIKLGTDYNANPDARTPKPAPGAGPVQKQKHAESSTLFIGNLPFDVTEDELRNLVESNAEAPAEAPEEKDEEAEEVDGEAAEAPHVNNRSGAKSGLIKTRVAQFEDTGRCKGFAFWDFKRPEFASAALANKRNHWLRGKRLTLQYASEEATKRAGGRRNRKDGEKGDKGKPRDKRPARYFDAAEGEGEDDSYEKSSRPAAPGDHKSEAAAQARIAAMVAGGEDDAPKPKGRNDKRGKKWETTGRPRPGAALAMAKRENVSIVESAGSKITFD